MTGFPLRYVHQNVLVGSGAERAALYRLVTVSYPFLSVAQQREWLGRLARLAFVVEGDFSLWRVSRAYPAGRYVTEKEALLDERGQSREAWHAYLQRHESHLRELGSFVPEVYLAVQLRGERPARFGASMLGAADRARRRVEELFGVAAAVPIPRSELEALVAEEERMLRRVAACVPARRASSRELQWLLRRAACRGVAEPELDEHWRPQALLVQADDGRAAYEPLETDLIRHANQPILEEDRTLVVDAQEGRGWQALLAVGGLPEKSEFPGGAELLFWPLERLGFPVDAVLHARWIANRDALTKARRRVLDADNAFTEQLASAHGPLSYTVEENRQMARERDAYLQATGRPPLLEAAISLAVGAPSRSELERRVEALRHQFGTVALQRPLGLQPALFLDHLPRADGGRVADYADVLTVEQFGALMAIGSHGAGSERGVYIGHTVAGHARPVKLDLTEASRRGRPPSVLLAGTLGSGKTIASELLAYQAERRGSLVVDVDPKPDHNLEALPELAGRVHVIELSGDDRYRGLLDPLAVAPPALREDLASSYLIELVPQAPAGWETQVRKAVRAAIEDQHPCCLRVLDILSRSANPDARAAGEALSVWADAGLGRLAFGDGTSARVAAGAAGGAVKARGGGGARPGGRRGDCARAARAGGAGRRAG